MNRSLPIAATLASLLCAAGVARAHFILKEPANWMSQDANGVPIKLGPCGNEPGGTPTNQVTAFQSGQTINVTVDEVIYHPGHYRVALAVHDRSELPGEPTVTPGSTTPCGTAAVMNPPVFPVLADGVLDHSTPFPGPQTFQIKLPDGVTCNNCTLQVIEFMSNHPLNNPGGCFYHHCADLSIQSASVTVDGGAGDGGTGGGGNGGGSSGCAYSTTAGRSALGALAALALLGLVAVRRRRRA